MSTQKLTDTTIDPAGEYASFITRTRYEDMPPQVIDFLKQRLLDTLACMVAGSRESGIPEAVDYARQCGGAPQSTVLVYGDRVSAAMAAFCNGPMARALDMGDCHPEGQHMSEYIVPLLFALAEAKGRVSGREFLTAYCVGGEVQARIGNACYGLSGISRYGKTVNYNQWGSVCAGANLVGLDLDATWSAIGIGYSITGSADFQCVAEGNQMLRMKHGFTCADAVHCVELARRGINGTRRVFLGPRGFLATQYPLKNDPAKLTAELGSRWEWLDTGTKAYACCYGSHAAITGTLDLMKKHDIAVEAIEKIECGLHPTSLALVAEPRDQKWNPTTPTEAQFSHPYCLATAIIKGRVMPDDYSDAERARKDVRGLMQRITAHARDANTPTFAGTVELITKRGESYAATVNHPYGSPANPLGWEGQIDKFRTCCAMAAKPITDAAIERVIHLCREFEHVTDVGEIMSLLSPRA